MLPFEPPSLARVMIPLDAVNDIRSGFDSRPVVSPIHAFSFEYAEEALSGGVVGTAAHRTHAAGELICLKESSVLFRDKLTAAIEVPNDWDATGPMPHRHQHRVHHQLSVLTRAHGPANHRLRIQIHHHAEIQPMFCRPNVGNDGHPFGVRDGGSEIPLQEIVAPSGTGAGRLHAPPSPLRRSQSRVTFRMLSGYCRGSRQVICSGKNPRARSVRTHCHRYGSRVSRAAVSGAPGCPLAVTG